jgi:hypothetical protein
MLMPKAAPGLWVYVDRLVIAHVVDDPPFGGQVERNDDCEDQKRQGWLAESLASRTLLPQRFPVKRFRRLGLVRARHRSPRAPCT